MLEMCSARLSSEIKHSCWVQLWDGSALGCVLSFVRSDGAQRSSAALLSCAEAAVTSQPLVWFVCLAESACCLVSSRVLTTKVQESKADQSGRTCIEVTDHDSAGMLQAGSRCRLVL